MYDISYLDILSNDSDGENDLFEITSVNSIPSSVGTVAINSDGDGLVFDPVENFSGVQYFYTPIQITEVCHLQCQL